MSASNVKRDEKLARRQQALDEQTKKTRTFRRNAIIVVVVLVLALAVALVINSNLFYTAFPAVTIGNTSYSAAETDVFFRSAYNSFYNTYANYIYSMLGSDADIDSYFQTFTGLDRSVALDEQQYSDEQTWADYFMEQTIENMKQVTALCDAAAAAGFVTPQEVVDEVDSSISSLRTTAALYGYSNLDQFLNLNYGKGVNANVLRNMMLKMETANHYAESVNEARVYSEEDTEAYYTEHADELDVIDHYYFLVSSSNAVFDELETDEEKLEAAHAAAAEIAEAATLEDFLAACAAYGTQPTLRHTSGNSLVTGISEWLLSAERKADDHTSIETDTGAYAVWFVARDDNDYAVRSMRHVLIMATADEDGTYSDEAILAAKERIHEIETEWKEDPTEEHFAELANSYSEDSGSNTNGGLYEDISKHQMVDAIDSFLFNEGAKAGDTTVVEGDNGSYHGWHLVYYVGEGELARTLLAEEPMREAEQTEWLEGLEANYTATTGSGLKYVQKS